MAYPVCSIHQLLAYIGPGAGLSLFGSVIGFFVLLATSALIVVSWPAVVLFKAVRNRFFSKPVKE